jgi:hypothetical protein
MAVNKCPQCAETIKREAKVCRFCGHNLPDRPVARSSHSIIKWLFISFAVLVGVRVISDAAGSNTVATGNPAGANSTETQASSPGAGWTYSDNKDEMRGTNEKTASVDSSNTLDFDFPYNGGSRGTLTLRQRQKDGFQAYLSVTKGQFMCHHFEGGRISVKFDNRPIQRFGCTDTSDGTTSVIFIESPKRLLAGLRKAKSMIIEAEFFHEGARQLTFPVEGLNWK